MRILGCALVALATLLGPAGTAMADERAGETPAVSSGVLVGSRSVTSGDQESPDAESPDAESPDADSRDASDSGPRSGVSVLAVLLTAGAALAAAGSGTAQAIARRRAVSGTPGSDSSDSA